MDPLVTSLETDLAMASVTKKDSVTPNKPTAPTPTTILLSPRTENHKLSCIHSAYSSHIAKVPATESQVLDQMAVDYDLATPEEQVEES